MTETSDVLTVLVAACENVNMSTDVKVVLSITANAEHLEDRRLLFEKEIDRFSAWMRENPDWKQQGALTRPERVLLLTYLMHKYEGHIDAGTYGGEKK
jgi:hypothetical protein